MIPDGLDFSAKTQIWTNKTISLLQKQQPLCNGPQEKQFCWSTRQGLQIAIFNMFKDLKEDVNKFLIWQWKRLRINLHMIITINICALSEPIIEVAGKTPRNIANWNSQSYHTCNFWAVKVQAAVSKHYFVWRKCHPQCYITHFK